MSNTSWPKAKLTTVALFPENYFLENLAVRADDTVPITALNHKELWYVPTHATKSAKPVLLHTFDQLTLSLTEVEPNVFYLCTSNAYTDHKSSLTSLLVTPVLSANSALRWPERQVQAVQNPPPRLAIDVVSTVDRPLHE